MTDDDLGPLTARVPEVLRGTAAYHVPQPPRVIAKLDANELPFGLPADLRAQLGAVLAEVALERYPDPRAARLRAVIANQQRRDYYRQNNYYGGNPYYGGNYYGNQGYYNQPRYYGGGQYYGY